jgi:hypothetical protein
MIAQPWHVKDDIEEVKSNTKLDEEQAGTGSPTNKQKSPESQKVQSLEIHRDPYADSNKRK